MGLIKEPLEIDFVVDSRALTRKEENAISELIRADKERRKRKRSRSKRITTRDKQKR